METFRKGIQETITAHQVDVQTGLSSQQVIQSREKNGANVFDAEKKVSLVKKILLSLNDVATIILLIAAAISLIATYFEKSGNYFESLLIIGIVVINSALAIIQEGLSLIHI